MLKLVQCEFAKLKRKKIIPLVFLSAFLFPIPITFLMATPRMLEKYPNKSVLFDGLFNMVMGYGVIFLLPCIIGVIAAMLFFMERDNDTFKNLRTIPVTSTQMIMATVEVPDEVADLLREYTLLEEAYRIRTYRYKAFYSLDYDGNIERDVALSQPSLLEIMEQRRMTDLLYQGLDTLTEKQRQRIYAHFFLGMSNADIARLEGCDITSVRDGIKRGLRQLEKYFEKNLL